MSPACSHEDLLLLAQEKIRGRRALRLQNHLAHCSFCQSDWETVSKIAAAALALQRREVSDELRERIWSRLHECPRLRSTPRPLMSRRVLVTGICAATLLAAATLFQSARKGVAFAQVIEAMEAVRTVQWDETRTWLNGQGVVDSVERSNCFVSWNPLSFYRKFPRGVIRSNEHRMVVYDGQGKIIEERAHGADLDYPGLREELLYQITAPRASRMADWRLDYIRVGGRPLLQFRQQWGGSGLWSDYTLWAEAGTL